jgi:hypothetical protein
MAEAEAEIQAESSEFADGLRIERKKAEEGGYIPSIIALITELDSWGPCESCGQMVAAIEEVQKEAKAVSGEPEAVVPEVSEDFGSLVADLQALAVELMAE